MWYYTSSVVTEKHARLTYFEHPMRAFCIFPLTDHKTGVLDEKNPVPVAVSSLFHKNLHNLRKKFNNIVPPHALF